jgi:hypothetical protein
MRVQVGAALIVSMVRMIDGGLPAMAWCLF